LSEVFVGLGRSAEELGVAQVQENAWVFVDPDHETYRAFLAQSPAEVLQGRVALPGIFVGFPSVKDPSWAARHPGKTTATAWGRQRATEDSAD